MIVGFINLIPIGNQFLYIFLIYTRVENRNLNKHKRFYATAFDISVLSCFKFLTVRKISTTYDDNLYPTVYFPVTIQLLRWNQYWLFWYFEDEFTNPKVLQFVKFCLGSFSWSPRVLAEHDLRTSGLRRCPVFMKLFYCLSI